MFQNIYPHVLHNDYFIRAPKNDDLVICADDRKILLAEESDGTLRVPTFAQIRAVSEKAAAQAFYLLALDERGFFFVPEKLPESGKMRYCNEMVLREMEHSALAFAAATALQLGQWYTLHQFCGRCGVPTVRSSSERAILCPKCAHLYYPRISPVVIVAVTDGDRLLLTRYSAATYKRHALVAGFVEVGETLEDAVRREVREEVGLHVRNIRYCESQPWPFSSSLIAGFFADVEGDPTIHLNADGKNELAEGIWVPRSELEIEDNSVSLTWDMIRKFKDGLDAR